MYIYRYIYFASVSSSTTTADKLSNYKYNIDSTYSSPSKISYHKLKKNKLKYVNIYNL